MGLIARIKQVFVGSATTATSGLFSSFMNLIYPTIGFDVRRYYTGWIFACINAIAEPVSTLELKLQQKKGGEWTDVDSHESLNLLKKVNNEMTSSQLFYSVPAWCEAEGNAFWIVVYSASGKPVELYPYDPNRINVHLNSDGFVDGYEVTTSAGKTIKLEKKEVLHFKRYNILDRYRGMGTIEAARVEADTDIHQANYNRNFYYNSAIPSAMLETDQGLTPEQLERIRNQWNQNYQGSENSHKTGILHSGLKFKPTQVNQKDMQFLESRKLQRDNILALFRTPPVLFGIIENANRANIMGAEYFLAKYRVKPYQEFIVDHLNEFYLPLWKLNPSEYRFALAKDPIPADEELELKKKQAGYGKWLTANEIRREEGREDRPDGDVLQVPGAAPQLATTDEEAQKALDFKKKIKIKAEDLVAQALNRFINKNDSKSAKKYTKFLKTTLADLLEKLKKQKDFKPSIKNPKDTVEKLANYIQMVKASEELVGLLFEDWEKMVGILFDSIKDDYQIGLKYGGKIALQRVGVDFQFDVENERAQDWINDTGLKNAKSIIGTLKDELRPIIAEAAKRGEGAQVIADEISEHYSNITDWKSLQIARTELANSYSQGTLEGYRQSDVVEKKKWLIVDANDAPCLENEAAGAIPLDDDFPSGDDAPPSHPNCKCCLIPVVNEE